MTAPTDWWNGFFTGLMSDFWQAVVPAEATLAEVGFFEKALALSPGARVLDAPCGHGRHAVELARRGYRVTGLDGSADLLAAARRRAAGERLSVDLREGDMRELPWQGAFDAAYCAGNSFGYFDDEGNRAFLRSVGRALVPGGRFALDSGAVAECLFPTLREKLEIEAAGIRFEAENRYDPRTGYLENLFTATRDGRRENRPGRQRVFTCRELIQWLWESGFDEIEAFGSPEGEPFALGAHRLLLCARRP